MVIHYVKPSESKPDDTNFKLVSIEEIYKWDYNTGLIKNQYMKVNKLTVASLAHIVEIISEHPSSKNGIA